MPPIELCGLPTDMTANSDLQIEIVLLTNGTADCGSELMLSSYRWQSRAAIDEQRVPTSHPQVRRLAHA